MGLLDKEFSSDWYAAILGNLKDNNYLSEEDVDTLLFDSLENKSIYLKNISAEKAEIVRNALRENFNKKFK